MARTCIFCGGGGLNEQHMIGKQLTKLLPKAPESEEFRRELQRFDEGSQRFDVVHSAALPGPLKHTAKVICETCNQTWVNDIETEAKPTLRALGLRHRGKVSRRQQLDLATWAVMVTMVAEFGDRSAHAISQADRRYMLQRHEPPPSFRVWAASAEGPLWLLGYRHIGFTVKAPGAGVAAGTPPRTTQLTRITFGGLAFLIFSPWSPAMAPRIGGPVAQIWPVGRLTRWPPGPSLSLSEAALWANRAHDVLVADLPKG